MAVCVITGGSGFLGSHLVERLLGEGHRVFCVDNLITGRRENVKNLEADPRFEFIKHDVCNYIARPGAVDYVFHFASPASPRDYLEFPIQTLKVGALGTHNTLGLAKEKGAVYVLASSSEVYGDPLSHPQKEDYAGNVNPIGPRGVYDEAKRFGEALAMAYYRTHGVPAMIARIFNTYGPRMRAEDGRAVPNFISQALRGEPLTVFGNGSQTRSFCYISDMVEGILRLSTSRVEGPVNLGNPRELTVLEMAQLVLRLTGGKSEIVYRGLPVDDPKVRRPDIQKAQKALAWEPKVPVEEGLKKTIAWFRDRYGL